MIGEAAKAIQESGGKHVGVFEARPACARGSPYGRFRGRFRGRCRQAQGCQWGAMPPCSTPTPKSPMPPLRRLARGLSATYCSPPFWTPAFSPAPPAPPQAKIIMAGRVLIILTIIAVSALLIYQVQ